MVELILGICDNCGEQLINKYWCKDCRMKYFIQRFTTWTSENDELNDFIQESQLNAKEEHGYFRWFSYDMFENIQMIGGNEGFSEVYYAMIKNDELCVMNFDRFCPPKYLEAPDSRLPDVVVLKRIINSGYMIKEFMKMVKNYYVCMDETIPKCYGITKDPLTQDYILVLQYANMKSLNDPNTLVNFSSSLPWAKKKEMFNTCVQALKIFHESNLVHSNLHPGNILLNESYSGSSKLTRNLYISDVEMCHPIDEQERSTSSRTFGVMPFIAPEILKGGKHTKSSNIYSLGMIFWCIISGELPYTLEAHDSFLAYEICKGKRPTIPRGTPKDFVELLNQCWESDPSKRPSINTIAFTLNWSAVSDGESMVYHSNDLYQHHPNACYSSRPIDFDFTFIDQIKPYI